MAVKKGAHDYLKLTINLFIIIRVTRKTFIIAKFTFPFSEFLIWQ